MLIKFGDVIIDKKIMILFLENIIYINGILKLNGIIVVDTGV